MDYTENATIHLEIHSTEILLVIAEISSVQYSEKVIFVSFMKFCWRIPPKTLTGVSSKKFLLGIPPWILPDVFVGISPGNSLEASLRIYTLI